MSRFGFVFASSILIAAAALGACSNAADDCQNTGTCDPVGGSSAAGTATGAKGGSQVGGNSSTGGSTAGDSGSAAGGSSAAGKGGSMAAAGEAGAGGVGGKLPCDGACAAPKPVCDEPADTCVECLEEGDCAAGVKKKCDTTAKACVECLAATDCSDAKLAKCDAGACAKCTSNDDCAHVAGKTVCDTAAGECVQCTGKDYASCGMSAGKPLVCDSKARTCTNTKEHSGGLCSPCVADAQCGLGQLCAKEQFGAPKQDVGYFCFWQQGAAIGGAPDDCTLPTNRPYVSTLKNQTSIDSAAATICGLRTSTCVARNQFSSKDCSTASASDDNKCGFAPTKDSKCLPFGASQFRCTITCGSDDDCPVNFPCDTNAPNPVCKLEP